MQELNNFLQSYRMTFELEIQDLRIPISQLRERFESFCVQHMGSFKGFFEQKFSIDQLESNEIIYVLRGEIFDKIVDKLQTIIDKNFEATQLNCLNSINLEHEFLFERFLSRLEESRLKVKE